MFVYFVNQSSLINLIQLKQLVSLYNSGSSPAVVTQWSKTRLINLFQTVQILPLAPGELVKSFCQPIFKVILICDLLTYWATVVSVILELVCQYQSQEFKKYQQYQSSNSWYWCNCQLSHWCEILVPYFKIIIPCTLNNMITFG